MNIKEITEGVHGWDKTFVPIKFLDNYGELEEILLSYDLDPEKFYYTGRMFAQYAYLNGSVLLNIEMIDKEYFNTFQMKERIEINEKKNAEHLLNKDYHSILFLIDKPFRFHWYVKLFKDIPNKDKYEIFIDIYTSSEYGFNELPPQFVETLIKKYKPEHKHELYTPYDEVPVFRGEGSKSLSYDKAFSWTLDVDVAMLFANRFREKGRLYQGFVKKDDILCYISDRQEKEVLILPGKVYDVDEIIY